MLLLKNWKIKVIVPSQLTRQSDMFWFFILPQSPAWGLCVSVTPALLSVQNRGKKVSMHLLIFPLSWTLTELWLPYQSMNWTVTSVNCHTPKCRYDVLLQWINWGCCLSRILSSCFIFTDDFSLCDHLMLYKKPTLCNSKSAALESLKCTYRLLIVLLDQIYLNINTAFFMHTWFLVGVGSKCRNLRLTCYTDDEAVNKSVSVT